MLTPLPILLMSLPTPDTVSPHPASAILDTMINNKINDLFIFDLFMSRIIKEKAISFKIWLFR